jgi:uncharacterized protein DUF4180
MTSKIGTYGDTRVLHVDDQGPTIASEDDGRDLLERAMHEDVRWIAVPVSRLDDVFFTLSTGLAGAIVQRLQNYGCGLAIVGDLDRDAAASPSFRALIAESNRTGGRGNLFFAADAADLQRRLQAPRG